MVAPAVEAGIIVGTELLKFILQSYGAAVRQSGMTPEQGKAYFDANYDKFMEVSAQPVEPVKP